MIRKSGLLFSTLLVLLAVAACGGNGAPGASPSGPSAPPVPQATAGATISGVINGAAAGSVAGLVGARDVTTVTATVGGMTFTATVNGAGKFVITGVPAGTITLTFSGTTATVTIPNVAQTETVTIVVTISGNNATVETEEREVDGQLQLEGRISGFEPVGAVGAARTGFYVGETLVTLGTTTQLRHGETPVTVDLLKAGDRVHVSGTAGTAIGTTPTMLATLVIVQNTNVKVPVNVKGTISAVTTACPLPSFVVQGWTVIVNDAGALKKGTCETVVVGAGVHVKGDVQPDGTVLATFVQFDK